MATAFEEDGYLWRPGQRDGDRASARLCFDPEFGTRLTVLNAAWATEPRAHWPVLHGESLWGAPWTLFSVRWSSSAGPDELTEACRADLTAWRLVTGVLADSEDDVAATDLFVNFHGLREWLTQGHEARPSALVRPEDAREDYWGGLTADVGDCSAYFYVDDLPRKSSWYRREHEARASLQLRSPRPLSLAQWERDWLAPIQHLLVFGMRRPSALSRLGGEVEGEPRPVGRAAGFTVYESWLPRIPQTTWTDYLGRTLLPANAVDDPGAFISAWIDLHRELGDAAEFLFGTLNDTDLPAVNRLLNLLAFAETYHRRKHDERPLSADEHADARAAMLQALPSDRDRRVYDSRLQHANAQSQRERIRWLIGRAAQADGRLEDVRRPLEKSLIETRNHLTHFSSASKWVTRTPHGYSLLAASLTYVLEACILLDLGLDPQRVRECLAAGRGWDDPIPALPRDEAPGRFDAD